jgi:hypothetical protein
MDVKEAIKRAKTYVAETFSDEDIIDVGLEEVRRDEDGRHWLITVGFSRASPRLRASRIKENSILGYNPDLPHVYKVVTLSDQDGDMISITNRAVEH